MLCVGSIHLRKAYGIPPPTERHVITMSQEARQKLQLGVTVSAPSDSSKHSGAMYLSSGLSSPIKFMRVPSVCLSPGWILTADHLQISTLCPLGGKKGINASNENKKMQLKSRNVHLPSLLTITLPFLLPTHCRKGFNNCYVAARSKDALAKILISREVV